ncbi:MAG TPA: translation initiation factor IF-2 N-terminal domain-containing protein, partial [Corynebacterium sp.]|nr:translation initiation factor IF-2 N-terminal domain-containing protein [Corynebacterium sp.]
MATKSTTENTETPQPDKAPAPKRRTTRKSSKKTNRKTAPPAGKATKKTTRGTAAPADSQPAPAESAAQLDRSTLSEKTRVHALAKMLGVASRDLIVSLDEVGLVKVAQSVLTRSEADRVLDHLAGVTEPALVEHDEEPQPAADSQTEEKIRTRVRKNVANEIHQIEEKVEADLAAAVDEARHEDPLE